MSSANWGGLGL